MAATMSAGGEAVRHSSPADLGMWVHTAAIFLAERAFCQSCSQRPSLLPVSRAVVAPAGLSTDLTNPFISLS